MAYTAPSAVTAGDALTATLYNTYVKDNIIDHESRIIANRASQVNVKSATTTSIVNFGAGGQTWYDFTGLSVSITPSSATSKILVFGHAHMGGTAGNLLYIQILRGATAVGNGSPYGSRSVVHVGGVSSQTDSNACIVLPFNYMDSPATTSATTYKIQAKSNGTIAFNGNTSYNNTDASYTAQAASTITVMEILV